MTVSNAKGSALMEALPVSILIVVFVTGLMVAAHLLFARSWIQYQSEQALYCAAESRLNVQCKYRLQEKLEQFLPWGDSTVQVQGGEDKWTVEVLWKYRDYSFHLHKELSPRLILNAKALPW